MKSNTKPRARARKPLLIISEANSMGMMQRPDPRKVEEAKTQAQSMGYDVLVLPLGVSAHVSVSR